jgi:Tol biopolymer transport system component
VGPFDTPTAIEILNSPSNDDDPTLRGDTLEIYFATNRNGSEEIFRSERADVDAEWMLPERVAAFDTVDSETTPELSADGLTIVLAIQDFDSETDLFLSTRASVDSLEWSGLQPIDDLNTPPGDLGLTFTEDLFTGYFCRRDMVGARLFRATRDRDNGPFDRVVELTLDSAEYECNPWIDAAGSTLVFASGDNDGERDIVFARVDGEGFEPTQVVDSVSSDADDNDPWLSPDGGLIVFSRYVNDHQELLWASRP